MCGEGRRHVFEHCALSLHAERFHVYDCRERVFVFDTVGAVGTVGELSWVGTCWKGC